MSSSYAIYRGNSQRTGAVKGPTPAPLTDVAWAFEAARKFVAAPVVADGVVYAGCRDGKVYALDAKTGKVVWAYTTGRRVMSSPTVCAGVAYVGSDDGFFYALDAVTGQPRWASRVDGRVRGSAAIAQGTVVFWTKTATPHDDTDADHEIDENDDVLVALDARTGSEKWRRGVRGRTAQCVHPAIHEGVVYVNGVASDGQSSERVQALDLVTGEVRWRHQCSPTGTFPVASDERVYVADFGGFLALQPKTGVTVVEAHPGLGIDLALGEKLIYAAHFHDSGEFALAAYLREGGRVVWRYAPPGPLGPPGDDAYLYHAPLLVGDVLLWAVGHWVRALEAATGKLLWRFRLPRSATSGAFVDRAMLYVACGKRLCALR